MGSLVSSNQASITFDWLLWHFPGPSRGLACSRELEGVPSGAVGRILDCSCGDPGSNLLPGTWQLRILGASEGQAACLLELGTSNLRSGVMHVLRVQREAERRFLWSIVDIPEKTLQLCQAAV